ncbi:uncharacterized protein LOC118191635 [Stegodyphus dumicola]|uniref:uncharacterized protein LOC118191635 n=1 Tax=Stegodyphus dumicola TaxID=202533 RepID=UPI0015B1DDF9|nr:uncharacterized protein LOC118191635 [Stegodyphus dumicola]
MLVIIRAIYFPCDTRGINRMQNALNVTTSGCCSFFRSKLPAIALDFNLSFLQSVPGIFKIAHTVLGLICLSVIAHYSQLFHPLTGSALGLLCSKSAAYFLLVSYACFVTSLVLLVSSVLSYCTASFLPKTAFEFAYHLVACITYLSSSLILLLSLVIKDKGNASYREPAFEAKVSVSVMGLINSILYGVSTYFSYQSQKQMA